MPLLILVVIAAAIAVIVWGRRRWRARRRRALRAAPFPSAWSAEIERLVPLYRRLPSAERQELHGHIHVLLDEKHFIGCAGLTVTETMRLSIAAQAALLLLKRDTGYFPGFRNIFVYPDTFLVPGVARDGMLETRTEEARLGESWKRGPVVLSWGDIVADAGADEPGYNVVLHEFAHKLDEEDDVMDGLPLLDDAAHYARWADVMTRAYEHLRRHADRRGDDGAIDGYAGTSPAEFFAVATEAFFERGAELRAGHPELYAELERYYRVDPASWI